jgi:hypothetical protein
MNACLVRLGVTSWVLLAVVGCADDRGEKNVASGEWQRAWIDTVSISRLGEQDDLPLFQVAGAALSGDTIIVAERSTGQLHLFSRSGKLLRSAGGLGEGPGEFRILWGLQKVGSAVHIYDIQLRRVSTFRSDGSFVRTFRIDPVDGFSATSLAGVFNDGSLLVYAYPQGDGPYTGFYRRTEILLRYDSEGNYLDSLGVYEGEDTYQKQLPQGGEFIARVPFGRRSAAALSADQYYLIENNDFAIGVFDQGGRKLREMQASENRQAPVSPEHARAIRSRYSPEVRGQLPMPDSFPPYGWHGPPKIRLMHVSSVGDLWVLNGEDLPAWTVFTKDGTERGHVRAFEELDVLDADDEIAVVLHWDELDVETVQVRRIRQ